ncbi:MAG: SDR family NAD(P)-dependent oxidoreductase [Planctomycetota bacterium]|jgi:3-oxoacyl-[acyl-carrier protein] reductase
MDTGLSDHVVIVTGASGGIGQATARAFAAEGASVVLHYHRQADAAEQLRGELGDAAISVAADLRDEDQTASMFDAAMDRFGRVDTVVVNAGIWSPDAVPLHSMSLEQWHNTLETDLTSAFLTCRAFLRHLADIPHEAASIVLVGSTAALLGEADHADYAAAKAGLVYGLTRSLKNEIVRLAPRGRVNAVCPGWTDTPMARHGTSDPEAMQRVLATMSLAKIATPEDVAWAIVYLASDRLAGHVTGAIVPVAGGMEGRLLRTP